MLVKSDDCSIEIKIFYYAIIYLWIYIKIFNKKYLNIFLNLEIRLNYALILGICGFSDIDC